MSRRRPPAVLVLVTAFLLALLGTGPALGGPAPSDTTVPELTGACVLKSNGLLRAATTSSDCKKSETFVAFKPGPVLVCVQPSGSTRKVDRLSLCKPPAQGVVLPPASGTVYFCVTTSTGAIRWVADPSQCVSGETAYGVTPNDDAPTLVSSSPADGATHVATNAVVSFTWSEAVTATSAAITATCGGSPTSGTVGGSGTSTLTFTPASPLGQGVSCTVTAVAGLISDVDTLDPPDHPAVNASTSFTTDTAPSVVSITPADGATNVAAGSNVVLVLSEPVTLDPGAVDLLCGDFTHPSFTLGGGGTDRVTVDPDSDLGAGWTCTVTVDLTKVHDVDAGDPPDTGTGTARSTFTTADDAPALVSTSPADGATHVGTGTDVVLTFSEPVQVPGAAAFSLTCGAAHDPVGFSLPSLSGSTLTVDPSGPLPEGQTCHLTGDATQITDVDTVDPPDELAANVSASFTIDAAPVVTSTTPADGTSGVATGSTLSVTFSEPVNASAGAFTLACDSADQPLGVTGDGTAAFTLTPLSTLPGTSACALTVHASGISDVDAGDPPDHPAADTTVGFTTVDAAPAVTAVSPADGATDVSRGTTIGVTFSEPVTFDTGAFLLECPTGTDIPLTVTPGGSSATLTPTASLPASTTCTLTVVASKVHDTDGIDPSTMAQDLTASFTTSANSAPTDLALSPSSVAENQPSGTAVGTLTTTDPDVGDSFTYALVSGTGSTDNGSFTVSGDQLLTAASFDFETRSSYSVRLRSTDGAGATVEKPLTVTVTDVNEAPTDITLSNASIDENQPSGTTVGTLSGSDPDTGQTLTFSLQASGCGGTFADNASFSITGTTLESAVTLDFEAKSSYSVCVRATDNGTPALSYDEQLTVTVNDVNDPPVAAPQSYGGVVGNTLAVRGTTASAPHVAITGNLLGVGATDQDAGDTVSVVAEASIASTKGGTASVNADGSFTYLPPAGLKSTTDTFTFHVTDGHVQSAGTATMTIGSQLVWYVDDTAAPGGSGRSTAPYDTLAPLNGAGGAGDADATGDTIFVYAGSGSYAGGLVLEQGQVLLGERAGLSVGGTTLVAAGSVAPVVTNAAGNGITLASGVSVQGVDVSGASADGINGSGVTTANVGDVTAVAVSGSGADGLDLSGAAGGDITVAATVATSGGRSVAVSGRTSGTVALTGAISGKGVELASNSGATLALSGGLALSTTTSPAFQATGGGTVTVSGSANTLSSTTGTALNVDSTAIGAAGLTFRSVSANGAANGIRLVNTGTAGGVRVTGTGSTTRGGDGSGGTIQNTTGAGVLLSQTRNVSLNNLTVSGTPSSSGILGTQVNGFTFTNGTVTNSGLTSKGASDSNIAFTGASANLTGAVTVSNSSLTNAYQHGILIQDTDGVVSSLHLDGNTITSTTSATTSAGNGIFLQVNGSASTAASVTSGTVSGNTVTGFPSGGGIIVVAGNERFAAAPSVTFGSGPGASAVAISGNAIAGFSSANPMNTQLVSVVLTGRASGFADVTNNGTVAAPLAFIRGNAVNVSADAAATLTSQVTGNVVKPQTQVSGSYGITGGTDRHVYATGTLDSAVLKANVSNNIATSTTGVGIYFVANGSGTSDLKVQNNTVGPPTDLVARPGIRVDSGTSSGMAVNTTVCLTISGNTVSGATDGANTYPGIGLRKEGSVATTNTFGITGLAPSPATGAQMEAYVSAQNPASAAGTFGTGGVANVSPTGFNYVSCTMPAF